MPEDMNKQVPEENLEPEEILEPEDNPELKPEDEVTPVEEEAVEAEETESLEETEEMPEDESCEECADEEEVDEEEVDEEEVDEDDLPEEFFEDEPPARNHKKRSWWLILLLVIIIISVFNTLWNKVEDKMENINVQVTEAVAAQDEMKASFEELKAVSDEQEVRLKKAERYITSFKNSMKDFDTEVDGIQNTANRHEEWLKKDLEAKKAELEKLTAVITELETILKGE